MSAKNDLVDVIERCTAVAERRSELRGQRITHEPAALRHFTARFERTR